MVLTWMLPWDLLFSPAVQTYHRQYFLNYLPLQFKSPIHLKLQHHWKSGVFDLHRLLWANFHWPWRAHILPWDSSCNWLPSLLFWSAGCFSTALGASEISSSLLPYWQNTSFNCWSAVVMWLRSVTWTFKLSQRRPSLKSLYVQRNICCNTYPSQCKPTCGDITFPITAITASPHPLAQCLSTFLCCFLVCNTGMIQPNHWPSSSQEGVRLTAGHSVWAQISHSPLEGEHWCRCIPSCILLTLYAFMGNCQYFHPRMYFLSQLHSSHWITDFLLLSSCSSNQLVCAGWGLRNFRAHLRSTWLNTLSLTSETPG